MHAKTLLSLILAAVGVGAVPGTASQPTDPVPTVIDLPLDDWIENTDLQWYGIIQVGTPPQNFTVLFDTGSSDLLLSKKGCTACGNHTQFDPALSSTFSPQPGTKQSFTFATAASTRPVKDTITIKCTEVSDTVTLHGTTADNQAFHVCENLPDDLRAGPVDGILGLAKPLTNDSLPLFWNWYYGGVLKEPLVSFYLPPGQRTNAAWATLGGVNKDKYNGEISWVDINKHLGMNSVDMQAIYIDSTEVVVPLPTDSATPSTSSVSAVPSPSSASPSATAAAGTAGDGLAPMRKNPALGLMDTGTAFIQAPDKQTTLALYKQISSDIHEIDEAGAFGAPCDVLDAIAPTIIFTVGLGPQAYNLTLDRELFNLGEYPGQPGICQAVFNSPYESLELLGKQVWVVGSPLLKTVYSVFDGVGFRIGFADMMEKLG